MTAELNRYFFSEKRDGSISKIFDRFSMCTFFETNAGCITPYNTRWHKNTNGFIIKSNRNYVEGIGDR